MFDSVFFQTVVLVGVAELFDKTFFIAMLLAMQNKTSAPWVFIGCYTALVLHVGMAAVLGYGIAHFVSIRTLDFCASALYFAFFLMYANDFHNASTDEMGALEDAQAELAAKVDKVEYGTMGEKRTTPLHAGPMGIMSMGFTSTLIGEFGDRTQFAMIGQHASQPIIPVCFGSCLAFFLVCAAAVACGAMISKLSVSEKHVACLGAVSFLTFAMVALWDGISGRADMHVSSGFLQAKPLP
eukprot:TRINITY_DN56060_c0_g1_i1.p1 TRINITY_DN56060_c0_g1~~TRINITY_DN56060_c0_g1_i1.p1  ORF type:complete len:261 (-),score=55.95 TRINITY_DN56060_c0_g1_i1:143-862(-)